MIMKFNPQLLNKNRFYTVLTNFVFSLMLTVRILLSFKKTERYIRLLWIIGTLVKVFRYVYFWNTTRFRFSNSIIIGLLLRALLLPLSRKRTTYGCIHTVFFTMFTVMIGIVVYSRTVLRVLF